MEITYFIQQFISIQKLMSFYDHKHAILSMQPTTLFFLACSYCDKYFNANTIQKIVDSMYIYSKFNSCLTNKVILTLHKFYKCQELLESCFDHEPLNVRMTLVLFNIRFNMSKLPENLQQKSGKSQAKIMLFQAWAASYELRRQIMF